MMPANGTLDTTSVAAQTALTEAAKLKAKDWFPSPQQATVVATILWNMAAAGFSLNATLLLRYLKVKWYLLPLPPPTIMVNLCVSNLLLVLGVLLATLTLTFDLGERGVHAGRVQLFLSVCVLLQSWLGQVMMAWCGSWAGEQGFQWRAGSLETSQSLADEGCSGKRGRTPSVGSRSTWGQRFLYQPCRRHSNLSQTAAGRICSEEAPVSCSGESFPAGTVPSLTSQQRNTVKWWLVWAWLLTILAAIVLLMTTTDDRNVCKTLDPFRRRYQILGDNISQVSYSEDSLLKIPILLVLLPVYLVGIGIIIRPAFPRAQSHPHRGRSSSQSNQARPGNAQKGRRQRGQNLEVRFESLGERSTCNINMNALKHWWLEEKQQNASSERPSSTEIGTELEDAEPDDRNKNAVFFPTVGNQQHMRKADKALSSEVEGTELEMDWSDSSIPRDERDAAFLLFVDDDTAKPMDRMPQSCLQPRETSAEEQVTTLAFDDTVDLALFELDEYVIYFNDTELEKSRSPLRYESEASLLSTASQQQAAIHSPGLPQPSEDKDNSSTHDAPGKALANEANADQYHKRDHCDHRPVVSKGGLEGQQDGIFLEGCDPHRSGAVSKSSGKYTDLNNHASKRLFMGSKAQKKMAGGQCLSNKSKTADPDTDSMSSGGDSNSFSNRSVPVVGDVTFSFA